MATPRTQDFPHVHLPRPGLVSARIKDMTDERMKEIIRQKMPGFVLVPPAPTPDLPTDSVNPGVAAWAGGEARPARARSETERDWFGKSLFLYRGYPDNVETRVVLVRPETDPSQNPIEIMISSDGELTPLQG